MFTKLILAVTATVLGGLATSSAAVAADGETKALNNNTFQEFASSGFCEPHASSCAVTFPPMIYATTVVKAVSCYTNVTLGSVVGFRLGTNSGGNQNFYMPGSIFDVGDLLGVSVNASTYMFFNKGESPYVMVFVSNGSFSGNTFACTITGEHS